MPSEASRPAYSGSRSSVCSVICCSKQVDRRGCSRKTYHTKPAPTEKTGPRNHRTTAVNKGNRFVVQFPFLRQRFGSIGYRRCSVAGGACVVAPKAGQRPFRPRTMRASGLLGTRNSLSASTNCRLAAGLVPVETTSGNYRTTRLYRPPVPAPSRRRRLGAGTGFFWGSGTPLSLQTPFYRHKAGRE